MSPIMRVSRGPTGSVMIEQLGTGERYRTPSEIERARLLGIDPEDEERAAPANPSSPPSDRQPATAPQRAKSGRGKKAPQAADPKVQQPETPPAAPQTDDPKARAPKMPPAPPQMDDDEADILAALEEGLGLDPGPLDEDLEGEPGDDLAGTENAPKPTPRSYPCPHCDFVAGSARGLNAHIKNRHEDDVGAEE